MAKLKRCFECKEYKQDFDLLGAVCRTCDARNARVMRRKALTGQDLIDSRNRAECLRCGEPQQNQDPDTGFPRVHCVFCAKWLDKQPKVDPSAIRYGRTHKAEGLDNLDRLTGRVTI